MTTKKPGNSRQKRQLVHLSAQISPDVKKILADYAASTKRTVSQATFHLIETHSEIVEFQNSQPQDK